MYSQQDEERFILECVADVERGSLAGHFLDIGAFHATTFSNTRALIERGWAGVLIEPSPGPLHGLLKEYGRQPHVKILGAAITVQGGLLDLEVTDDAVTMPLGSPQLEQWQETGGFFGTLTVPSMSMRTLFDAISGAFDFVNIDTEGTSVDLFAEMLRLGPRPRCVCLEHDNRHVEIATHAEAASYRQIHLNSTNVILEWTSGR